MITIPRFLTRARLCRAAALPLRALPDALHARAAGAAGNLLFDRLGVTDRLAALHGRTVCLAVSDTGSRVCLTIDHGRLRPATAPADVTISGRLADFCALADRSEDPDTLFFNRRLCIEGDTETGLHVKNILDTVDLDWRAMLGRLIGAEALDVLAGLFHRRAAARGGGRIKPAGTRGP